MYLFNLFRNLARKSRVEADLDSELRGFEDQLVEEKLRSGLDPASARRAAALELGGREQVKEEVRSARAGHGLEELLRDLRYGARALWKAPAFTLAAVVALALGIGANTAMFSVAYGILVRPLPYPDADRLASVTMHFSPQNFEYGTMCVADFLDWQAHNHIFQDVAAYGTRRMDTLANGEPEQVAGATVTAAFFSTLDVQPLDGRGFLPGEDRPNAVSGVVLSEAYARRHFGTASPIGKTISINGDAATVVGVMPAAFRFPRPDTELWTNLRLLPPTRRGPFILRGIARLNPGATLAQAQAETNAIGRGIMRDNPYYRNLTLPVVGMREWLVGRATRQALLVLLAAVALVLLIAVVNVANLLLARATVREREMALRLSLGAGRGRLLRQLLTESVLLSLAGGAAGLAFAQAALRVLHAWNPGKLPLLDSVRMDGTVLVFLFLISLVTGVLFGLAPALESTRVNLAAMLQERGRGSGGQGRSRFRSALVISEIALSLMLLVGAGLLLRSFARLQQVDGGFSAPPGRILTVALSASDKKYDSETAGLNLYEQVLDRVRSIPGVESAALSDSLPPTRQADADTFVIEGQSLGRGETNPAVTDAAVSPEYFRALGVPLLRGRYFTDHDRANGAAVTIVSDSFARRFFPNQNPVGRRLKPSGPENAAPYCEIVGVVGDVKYTGLEKDTDAAYYMPLAQNYQRRMFVVVRTSGAAASVAGEVRRAIHSVDAGLPLSGAATLEQALAESVAQPRFDALLLALFSAIALVLAAVGIYGIVSYSVAQRTHEIGVRMALGARRVDVVTMVMRQAARLAAIGIVLGVAGAAALTRLLETLLFGTSPHDTLTFALVSCGLFAVAMLASFVPARRATGVDALVALRWE